MDFKNFYAGGRFAVSLEIFPPKNEAGIVSLFEALKDLSQYNPAFVSVTYGAMGTTRDLTRDLALRIFKELGLATAFHFTCVGSDRKGIREYVEKLKAEGLNLVVALRGDPPQGSRGFVPPKDGFGNANELVAYLKEIDGFSIAVAGYPEGHVECRSKEEDLKNLKRKVDAGADVVVTQLFYDNRDYFDFVERARAIGIQIPIVPGILPITNLKQIEKISSLCGAKLPEALHQQLQMYQDDPETIKKIGIDHAKWQCEELKLKGAPGIHFYTMNRSDIVGSIIETLS